MIYVLRVQALLLLVLHKVRCYVPVPMLCYAALLVLTTLSMLQMPLKVFVAAKVNGSLSPPHVFFNQFFALTALLSFYSTPRDQPFILR